MTTAFGEGVGVCGGNMVREPIESGRAVGGALGGLWTSHRRTALARCFDLPPLALRSLVMTTHDGEQTLAGRDEREPVRQEADELRVRFQQLPDPGVARARSQQARSARTALMGAGALVALYSLVGIAGRLDGGAGAWTAAHALGLACAGSAVEWARRGRTRWALMAIIVGAVGATLGNALP
ncbi:hypothetical protein DMH26_19550 [Streptomyces sp. WAC 05379]|nr:hypothetical protein DMH26_19550 [Streptomyces sp. WAC 05379]